MAALQKKKTPRTAPNGFKSPSPASDKETIDENCQPISPPKEIRLPTCCTSENCSELPNSSKKSNIKIGDFGLAASLVNGNDRKRTICGIPNYIAPEVLSGSGKEGQGRSFEIDLWGVGVIFWPEEVPVSSAAKHLVHSIPNHGAGSRPTLDEIADHYFFKSGFFPRSIRVSAGKQQPVWRGASGQGVGAVGNRQDWIKNCEEVARECSIGVRSDGKPVSAVGDHADESVEHLTLPPSRPISALSIGDGNQPFAVEKHTANMKPEAKARKRKGTVHKTAMRECGVPMHLRKSHPDYGHEDMLRKLEEKNWKLKGGKGRFPGRNINKDKRVAEVKTLAERSVPLRIAKEKGFWSRI
ncbi:unnamed protein product [Tuber aestivum]|uniref:Protein kinase domain-containing protein n=1 Tax=Tuber aestivum TaxID=59557 RepID=A0A292PX54_9PEZI|nr:unnamed protein product [Tuber aestivum]